MNCCVTTSQRCRMRYNTPARSGLSLARTGVEGALACTVARVRGRLRPRAEGRPPGWMIGRLAGQSFVAARWLGRPAGFVIAVYTERRMTTRGMARCLATLQL